MCYAIPGKLIEKKGTTGVVDYYGEKKNVVIALDNVKVGDYVYAQGGVLINKLSEKDALEIIDSWKEMFFALKETDKKMARVDSTYAGAPAGLLEVIEKVTRGIPLKRPEMARILEETDGHGLKLIYDTANNIRQKVQGNACCVHGIIEFSNFCRNDCFFCGIRAGRPIERYRMDVGEIERTAEYAAGELGFKALVLQGGEDLWYDEAKLVRIVRHIKNLGVLVFLSLGTREKSLYDRLYAEGARAALLRFETSDRELFKELRPGTDLDERLDLIRHLKKTGYVLATGFITGLPGELTDTVIDNLLLASSLAPDMYSFGPFIPAEDTPLAGHKMPDKDSVLKTIALCRFLERDSRILVTTALETLDMSARKEGLLAGANSVMINVTPPTLRKLYSIYDNRASDDADTREEIQKTLELLQLLGRAPTDLGI